MPSEDELKRLHQQSERLSTAIQNNLRRALRSAAEEFVKMSGKGGAAFENVLTDLHALASGVGPESQRAAKDMLKGVKDAMSQVPPELRQSFGKSTRDVLALSSGLFQRYGVDVGRSVHEISTLQTTASDNYLTRAASNFQTLRGLALAQGKTQAEATAIASSAQALQIGDHIQGKVTERAQIQGQVRAGIISQTDGAKAVQKIDEDVGRSMAKAAGTRTRATEIAEAGKRKASDQTLSKITLNDKTAVGSKLRSMVMEGGMMRRIVDKEQEAAAGKAVSFSIGERMARGGVAGFAKLAGSLMPFIASTTVVVGALKMMLDMFNQQRQIGATAFAAESTRNVQRGNSFRTAGRLAAAVFTETRDLREQAAIHGVSMDKLNIASLNHLVNLYGRGAKSTTEEWVSTYSRIQARAPLAGLSAAEGMDFATKAQRAFALDNQGVLTYFERIRALARGAGMSFKEFSGRMGDVNELGAVFGTKTGRQIIDTVALMGAGFEGSSAQAGLLMDVTKSIAAAPMMKSIAMQMAGTGAGFAQAAQNLITTDNLATMNIAGFRGMVDRLGMDPRGADPGRKAMAAQFFEQFTGRRGAGMAFLKSEELQNAVMSGNIDQKKLTELVNKNLDVNVERDSFRMLGMQQNILEQILNVVREMMISIAGSWVMSSSAANRLRSAAGDRQAAREAGFAAISLGTGKRTE